MTALEKRLARAEKQAGLACSDGPSVVSDESLDGWFERHRVRLERWRGLLEHGNESELANYLRELDAADAETTRDLGVGATAVHRLARLARQLRRAQVTKRIAELRGVPPSDATAPAPASTCQ